MLEWRDGLRSRLVLLVLIALLPIFGLAIYTVISNERAAIELARADLQAEALLAAADQQRMIERIGQLLNDIASGPSIKDTRIRLCVPYLKNLKQQDNSFANLGVIGLDGVVNCHALSSPTAGRLYLGDRVFFNRVLASKKFEVGEFGIGPATGLPSMGLGLPVYGNDGVFNGVAFVALNLAAVNEVLSRTKIAEGAELRLIDRRHVILGTSPAKTAGSPSLCIHPPALIQPSCSPGWPVVAPTQ